MQGSRCIFTCGLTRGQRFVGVPAVLALVDGFVDAADGAVEAWLAQDEGDDAVLQGHDGAQDPPVGGHDGVLVRWYSCGDICVCGAGVKGGRGIGVGGGGMSERSVITSRSCGEQPSHASRWRAPSSITTNSSQRHLPPSASQLHSFINFSNQVYNVRPSFQASLRSIRHGPTGSACPPTITTAWFRTSARDTGYRQSRQERSSHGHQMPVNFFSFLIKSTNPRYFSILVLQELEHERRKVVHLANLNALLSHNVVRRGEVEVDVGDGVALDVLPALHLLLGLALSHADGDNLIVAAVDGVGLDASQLGLDLGDAGLHGVKRLQVVGVFLGLGARGAGNHLVDSGRDDEDLEGEGQHVGVDASGGNLVGDGRALGLGDDSRQAGEDVLGHANRGVVQRVRHFDDVFVLGGADLTRW